MIGEKLQFNSSEQNFFFFSRAESEEGTQQFSFTHKNRFRSDPTEDIQSREILGNLKSLEV